MSEVQEALLTDEQVAQYERDGYLIVHDLLTEEDIDSFVAYEAEDKPEGWRENLRHHVDDERWAHIAKHPRIAGIAQQLIGGRPMIVQTMYMEREPAREGEAGTPGVALHQDLHYLPTEPDTLLACWVAITDTDPGNGGLCIVPGSHEHGLYETQKNEDTVEHDAWEVEHLMRDRDGKEWTQRMYSFDIEGLDPDDVVRLTVPKGAGVFFDGLTIHGSYANRSKERYRRAFATHYIDEKSWLLRADVQDVVPAV
ncbi:MAG TPA: phytanoyl-CoA dioxygenase family protein [Rhodothermales bacterium]|nr:phytanoyl-CoA dioxygenase family protein [Rhodothermales bacterium]